MAIEISYDSTVTSLSSTLKAEFEGAVSTAVAYYNSLFANLPTLDITFSYGSINGGTIGGAGENISNYETYTYSQLYSAATAADTTSTVQEAALSILPTSDPTNGTGAFWITQAQAITLGLAGPSTSSVGDVGLSSSLSYAWTQVALSGSNYDAVGILEHEIAEVLGRTAQLGMSVFDSQADYTLLDFYHYSAANGASGASPGSAAGALDEPFAPGYNASADAYFSYDGATVGLAYNTPSQVAQGQDVADWTNTIMGDSYGSAYNGVVGAVTTTDLQEMNVLGYAIADTIHEVTPASLNAKTNTAILLSGVSISDTSVVGQILTTRLTAAHGVFAVGSANGATIAGDGTGSLALTGTSAEITAALATASYRGAANYVGSDAISATTTDAVGDTSGTNTIAMTVGDPSETVAQFVASRSSLDALVGGFSIADSAANVSGDFDALNSDAHINAIQLTDAGVATLALTVAQALNDTFALSAIANPSHAIDIVDSAADIELLTSAEITTLESRGLKAIAANDASAALNVGQAIALEATAVKVGAPSGYAVTLAATAANLATLTASEIAGLTGIGVSALVATDASIRYTITQSEAIRTAGLQVSVPANDLARENFADGSSLVWNFGAGGALAKLVTTNADGSFDVRYYGVSGTFQGVSYSGQDVAFAAAGVRDAQTFYDPSDNVVASETFTSNGGFSIMVGGTLVKQRTVQTDGSFDVRYFEAPGTFMGVSYSGYDAGFTSAGVRDAKAYYDAGGNVLASETFTGNGGYSITVGGTLVKQKMVDSDGNYELSFGGVQGQTYSSYQNDFNATGVELAHSFDNVVGSGQVNLFGSGLRVAAPLGEIGVAGSANDFQFTAHASETYALFSGASNDVIAFDPGFGAATVTGLGAAGAITDSLDLSGLFTSFADAQGHMAASGGNTILTDVSGDTLTIVGMAPTALTAARLGL